MLCKSWKSPPCHDSVWMVHYFPESSCELQGQSSSLNWTMAPKMILDTSGIFFSVKECVRSFWIHSELVRGRVTIWKLLFQGWSNHTDLFNVARLRVGNKKFWKVFNFFASFRPVTLPAIVSRIVGKKNCSTQLTLNEYTFFLLNNVGKKISFCLQTFKKPAVTFYTNSPTHVHQCMKHWLPLSACLHTNLNLIKVEILSQHPLELADFEHISVILIKNDFVIVLDRKF